MKKFYFCIIALCFTWQLRAQMPYIMPKFGASFARQSYSGSYLNSVPGFFEKLNSDNIKSNFGFSGGVAFIKGITEDSRYISFSLQAELLFTQKGIKIDYKDLNTHQSETRNLNYLELPIMVKMVFGNTNFKYFAYFGPSAGYVLGGTYKTKKICNCNGNPETVQSGKIKFQDGTNGINANGDYTLNARRLDFGMQGGIGASYTIGYDMIMLDVRYGYGFSNFLKTQTDQPSNYTKSKNQVVSISIGYAIHLK